MKNAEIEWPPLNPERQATLDRLLGAQQKFNDFIKSRPSETGERDKGEEDFSKVIRGIEFKLSLAIDRTRMGTIKLLDYESPENIEKIVNHFIELYTAYVERVK
jgi:hypothetical protein